MPIQTIREADEFFASLPDGFDAASDFAAVLPPAGAVQYIPIAGTAGKTAVARLTAGILTAAGFAAGLYCAPALYCAALPCIPDSAFSSSASSEGLPILWITASTRA